MTTKLYLYAYKPGSKSAKDLATTLDIKRIKHERSRFRHTNNRLIINWGSSTVPYSIDPNRVLNHPYSVTKASNKLITLQKLAEHRVPHIEWTTNKELAHHWLQEGHKVYARTILNGHSGNGIVILNSPTNVIEAPLYTKHFKKKHEYRVHVGVKDGEVGSVIHIQQKRLRHDAPQEREEGIRNHANGWIFACNDIIPLSEEAQQIAVKGVLALGLDFGAVDLLVNRNGEAVICEINTAPGIEGTTLQKYVEFFNSFR